MPSPQMIDGMRQPQSVRLEDIRKSTESAFGSGPTYAPAGVNVYVSNARGYLVEVKNSRSFIQDGERIPGQRIAAQFVEGVFRNDHEDPAVRALIDERLQRNKYFGKFGGGPLVHFWLASDQNERTKAAGIKSALNTLKSLPPEVLAQYVADLAQGEGDDHAMTPTAPSAAEARAQRTTAKPIAS